MQELKRLKEFRVQKKLSREKLARILNVSLSTATRIERGEAKASRGFMDRMKNVYPEISIDYLFYDK